MNNIVVQVGKGKNDNRPKPYPIEPRKMLSTWFRKHRHGAKDGPFFQLVKYLNGAHRDKEHIGEIYGYVADIDKGEWSRDAIERALSGYAFAAFTTHSHTPLKPRWRIVIVFNRPVDVATFEAIHDQFFAPLFGADLDEKSRRPAQLWYTPACPRDYAQAAAAFYIDGELFNVDGYQAAAETDYRPKGAQRARVEEMSNAAIDAWNKEFTLEEMLETYGYTMESETRSAWCWLHPDSSSGNPAAWVYKDDGLLYCHSAGDPLRPSDEEEAAQAGKRDSFDVMRIMKFGGDWKLAFQHAEEVCGIGPKVRFGGKANGEQPDDPEPEPEAEHEAESETDQTWAETIAELAKLEPHEYDRIRKEKAGELGVQLKTLDRAVATARREEDKAGGEGSAIEFEAVEPWPEAVDGDRLLQDVIARVHRHVVVSRSGALATALYIIATYLIDVAQYAPRLLVKSPTKRCGKTTLLGIIARTAHKPLAGSNISGAAVYRVIEQTQPTLLLDEADTFLKQNEELGGVVNSGHSRMLAKVIRIVPIGDSYEARQFNTFAMMIVASIKAQTDTFEDRSVIVSLKRRAATEAVADVDDEDTAEMRELRSRIQRFADDHRAQVRQSKRHKIPGCNDRVWDNWWPLIAVARCCGPEWVEKAESAARDLAGGAENDEREMLLLADVRAVFEARQREGKDQWDRIHSSTLAQRLNDMPDRPWADYKSREGGITTHKIAAMLRGFGICPQDIRVGKGKDSKNSSGYLYGDCLEAFSRYLDPPPDDAE